MKISYSSAVAFQLDAVTGRSYTYEEAKNISQRFGSSLRKMGIKKEDVVAIFMSNSPDYITCLTGIIGVGAVATPINPNYTEFELETQLEMSKASCIIADSSTLKVVKKAIENDKGKYAILSAHFILLFDI